MRVGLTAKPEAKALLIASRLQELLKKCGIDVVIDSMLKPFLRIEGQSFVLGEDIDLLIVVGGDGTLLRALHYYPNTSLHVVGVRVGRRGVLTGYESWELDKLAEDISCNKLAWIKISRVQIRLETRTWATPPKALNEIAILSHGGKNVVLHVQFPKFNVEYKIEGDGVIIASSIGSRAYSLSAGGTVIPEDMAALLVTPLNVYEGLVASIITDEVIVKVDKGSKIVKLVIDGQWSIELTPNSVVKATVDNKHPVLIGYPRDRLQRLYALTQHRLRE